MKGLTLLLTAGTFAFAAGARAQDCATAPVVTVREINEIPEQLTGQLATGGAALAGTRIRALLTNGLEDKIVLFTAVLLSDGRGSDEARVFVRDTSAVGQGVAGMTTQIVDEAELMEAFAPGGVVDVCGRVSPSDVGEAGKVMRVVPLSVTRAGGPITASDPLRQPVVVRPDDVRRRLSAGTSRFDWASFGAFNGQYVRFEGTEGAGFLVYEGGSGDLARSAQEGPVFRFVPMREADFSLARAEAGAEAQASAVAAGTFALQEAHPNPVRDEASVRYAIGRSGRVRLELYDVTGRRVATLADGEREAGAFEAALDARELAAGAYALRLTTGETVLTRRVVVVR